MTTSNLRSKVSKKTVKGVKKRKSRSKESHKYLKSLIVVIFKGVFDLANLRNFGYFLMGLGIMITLFAKEIGTFEVFPPSKEIGFFLLLIGFVLGLEK